ncbi:prepilin-type N-terminal cleavage/methylation domain-containing protein [Synechococcus sp. ATX 2A4]|nr:prepilin-type N-terminal cleavage/methylation domain-containing protein [Synechococcus sp. ATX 2A4]
MFKTASFKNIFRFQAFTVAELMVTVAVIGVLSAVVFTSSQAFLRRDQANAAAAELVGWLEAISARSGSVGPCTVQFTAANGLAPGATFASLQAGDARCTPEPNLALPATDGNRTYNVAVTYTPNGTTALAFTNRAGVVANGVEAVVRISVNNQLPLRCVRIRFGTLSTGINNATGDVAQTCTVWERT